MSEVHPYPEWKSAVEKFLRQGFSDGEILTHDWLFAALLLKKPDNETPYRDAKRIEILFLQRFQKFQRHLLEEHQIDLVSVTGVGYRITPPQEQTESATDQMMKDLRKAIRKGTMRVANVDHSKLSAEERKENIDALAKISRLRSNMRGRRQLPKPDQE